LSELGKRGIRVVGVSVDPVEVSRMLGERAGLTFPLLSDPEEKVIALTISCTSGAVPKE
jgi:peroxiredoxin